MAEDGTNDRVFSGVPERTAALVAELAHSKRALNGALRERNEADNDLTKEREKIVQITRAFHAMRKERDTAAQDLSRERGRAAELSQRYGLLIEAAERDSDALSVALRTGEEVRKCQVELIRELQLGAGQLMQVSLKTNSSVAKRAPMNTSDEQFKPIMPPPPPYYVMAEKDGDKNELRMPVKGTSTRKISHEVSLSPKSANAENGQPAIKPLKIRPSPRLGGKRRDRAPPKSRRTIFS